nr:glycosyltransferase family 4 protein [Bacteroidota bacterium]
MFSAKVLISTIRDKPRLVLFVSNPPFVPFIGFLLKLLSAQRYAILVYDIYPDILIGLNHISETSIITRIWSRANKVVYENSVAVVTIGDRMANTLENSFDSSKTFTGKVDVIHNCANSDQFKPIPKESNTFAVEYNQIDKLTVMYSGNFGYSHSFENIVNVAKKLIKDETINIFLIGGGSRKNSIISEIQIKNLVNIICLPYQDDIVFPKALASADIALITMTAGSEELMVPSKIYYSMAVGSALIGITNNNSELAKIIKDNECGVVVSPDSVEELYDAILLLKKDSSLLNLYRENAYNSFVDNYNQNIMIERYNEIIGRIYSALERNQLI